jgi:cobalt/nickel transport system permease protein
MHMADALLSPAVGGAFVAASGGVLAYSARRVGRQTDERRVPLMGVLGAFVFAAQMINFAIPGTGSSGHLGGGMLLAILLGPYAAFLVISSVLVVQCLFFADGGVLALGTNIFNLGVWPCFLGLLIYRAIAGRRPPAWRLWSGALVATVVSLELGALGVVAQTLLSGRTDLAFGHFAGLMLGIHLPIALVEGAVTAGVVQYVRALRPTVVNGTGLADIADPATGRGEMFVPVIGSLAAMAILTGCVLAWFASPHPDGLEWSLERARGTGAIEDRSALPVLERVQDKTAVLPDYGFRSDSASTSTVAAVGAAEGAWPDVQGGTSLAGLVGSILTFAVVCLLGVALYWMQSRRKPQSA